MESLLGPITLPLYAAILKVAFLFFVSLVISAEVVFAPFTVFLSTYFFVVVLYL